MSHKGKLFYSCDKRVGEYIFWYTKSNGGKAIDFGEPEVWHWRGNFSEEKNYLIGASCLAQW